MAYEALDSLRKTLHRILKQSHHPDVNQELISIQDEVFAFELHLMNNQENLQERIGDAASAMEEIIEYLFSEENPSYSGWMKPTAGHRNQLKEATLYFKSTAGGEGGSVNTEQQLSSSSKDVVVGFEEDLRDIKKWITGSNQTSQLQVFSIVGTGGIGKTTLAKLAYNDESIVKYFEIRAWVTVSHDYTVASVVFNLLASLEEGGIPVERDGHNEIPMEALIKTHLNRGRFLIVIDDVWSKKAWDDLKTLFPDTDSSSRIILTTRLPDVADHVNSSIPVHFMRLLDAHDSWDLLKKKVFLDGSCPIQLEDVGRKIVKICGGLPLSIVLVAGILSKLPQTRYSWKQYASNYGTLETIITLSYNHLPEQMRKCFLYMGGFPEDYEIYASELIKLWIAEGFLQCPTRSKSQEEEAAEALDNLVERSLVLVGRRKFDGKIKSCMLHDIVRDFCIREAQRDKFLLSVMDFLPTPILRRHFLPRLLKTYDRISASLHDLDLKNSKHSSSTHSIICIPQRGYKCMSSMHKFSSLKVFHVLRRKDNWEWEPSQVLDLIYITYLSCNIPSIPSTISTLKNIQTLIIYRSEVVLPVEIWTLRQLRHLMAFSFHLLPSQEDADLPLENLHTLSLVTDFVCNQRMVEMIPNIKKLGLCYSAQNVEEHKIETSRYACNLHYLARLIGLEKLKLDTSRSIWASIPFFPESLKKLNLSGGRFPWSDMRIVGSLPNLEVLKLRNYACDGEVWETTGGFWQLRFLLIDESNLQYWTTTDFLCFLSLQCLILHCCPYLSEIPSYMGSPSTFKLIEIDDRNQTLVDSAKKIKEEKIFNLEVHVKHF